LKNVIAQLEGGNMGLPERVREIIQERGMSQKDFAQKLNVTGSYISKLLRGESGMATATALLIEKLLGYSKEWILNGTEPKLLDQERDRELTPLKRQILADVERMTPEELKSVYIYIKTLRQTYKDFDESSQGV
jgi:transcriptional regulator with XRE-family HTH domain